MVGVNYMIKILGYDIYNKTKTELINEIFDSKEKIHIVSGNPEVLYTGLDDKELFKNFTSKSSIIIPDGIGVVLSAKLSNKYIEEKIAGIETMDEIINRCEKENKSIYLLGTKNEILAICEEKLKLKYPSLIIAGSNDGYFDMNSCEHIVKDIKEKKPFALFVAMGCPRQERFIVKYMEELPCNIFMGVGGSFDVIAGQSNRAPKWMIDMGLEWLYRVSKEPWRIKRLGVIPKFIFKAVLKQN